MTQSKPVPACCVTQGAHLSRAVTQGAHWSLAPVFLQ